VPYKAVAPALTDLLGGQVHTLFAGFPAAIPHVKSGKLRGLAVTSAKRLAIAAEIPTVAEQGLPGFEVTQWFGVFAPAQTPPEIITRLHREFAAVLAMPDVAEKLNAQGAEPVGSPPQEFAAFVHAELDKFGKLVKQSGATVDQ
jgi:tripartite-type tricarboxylate transporter receptor subunit TctC